MKKNDVAKMSMMGFFCSTAGALVALGAKIKLGADRLSALEAASTKYADKAAEALFKGDAAKAGKAMSLKLHMDILRAKHWGHSDPQTAKQLSMDTLRQMAEFYARGSCPRSVQEAILDVSVALAGGGVPKRRGDTLKNAIKDKKDLGLFATVKIILHGATELEVVARAARGNPSWRDWVEASGDVYTARERAVALVFGGALEAQANGKSPAAGVKEELRRLEAELGAGMDFEAIRQAAKSRFGGKRTSSRVEDLGRGAMTLAALDQALDELKKELTTSSRGQGLSGRLLERREIQEGLSLDKGSEPTEPKSGGSSRL